MRANAPLYSMNAGEVSKIALARVDVAKLRMAAACQVNWLPYVVGPMAMRPGLYYVGGVNGASQTRLLPFVYAKTDTALIELTAPPRGGRHQHRRPVLQRRRRVVDGGHHVGRLGRDRRRRRHAGLSSDRRPGAD